MRHLYLAVATILALGTAAVPASAAQVQTDTKPIAAPLAALQNGELTTNYAQYRRWHGGPYYRHGYYGRPYYYGYGRPYYRRGWGDAAAVGALGLATGAIIGGAIASQQAAPTYVVPNGGGAVAYCAQRFRSYDPASGTYLGYDGMRHPCP